MVRRLALALALLVSLSALALLMPRASSQAGQAQFLVVGSNGVALCYPYLVEASGLENLVTGSNVSLWPNDVALQATCSQGYIVVIGEHGAYFISSQGPYLARFSELPYDDFVGASGDMVAYFINRTVFVVTPSYDYVMYPPPDFTPISFSVNSGVPEVLLYHNGTFALEFPPNTVFYLNVTSPYQGGIVNGSTLLISTGNGTVYVYSLVPYARPLLVATYQAPVTLTKVYMVSGNYVLGLSGAGTTLLQLGQPTQARFLGNAVPTPVGYYAPDLGYTFVLSSGSWVPVPGYAIGLLAGLAAVTDIPGGLTALYPLYPTLLSLRAPLLGTLVMGNVSLAASLTPGLYALPSPSVLQAAGFAVQLMGGYEEYPMSVSSPVTSTLIVYAPSAQPVESFSGVSYVSAGSGGLLMITPGQAVVLTANGRTLTIPGTWSFGGLGPAGVALYSGGTVYIYNYQGQQVTSYHILIGYVPMIMSPYQLGNNYYLLLEGPGAPGNGTIYIYGPSGVTSFQETLRVEDVGTGVSVVFSPSSSAGYIQAGPLTIPIQVQKFYASVNGLLVAYRTPSGDYVIDDLATGDQYVVLDAPLMPVYPLGNGLIATYDAKAGVVNVLSLPQIELGELKLVVMSSPGSSIYVNGTLAGVGQATVFAPYGATLNITAAKPYTLPSTTIVHLTSPGTVYVSPVPLTAYVALRVSSPIPISSVEATFNGTSVTWAVNGTVSLTAGIPYSIEITSASPMNYCRPESAVLVFPPGNNTFTFNCTLSVPVLELYSSLPASVTIATPTGTVASVNLTPGVPRYLAMTPGTYTLLSTTSVSGRAPLTLPISIGSPGLYAYNVTPPPAASVGVLTVYSNVPYANITVKYENGTAVVSRIGSVSISLRPGVYLVSASAPGYVNVTKSVIVSAGSTLSVVLPLTPYTPPVHRVPPTRLIVIGAAAGATAAAAGLGLVIYRRSRLPPEEVQI